MTENNENQATEETERDRLEDTELKEHIDKIKIFRLLLPKNPAEVMAHEPEDEVDSTYNFKMVIDKWNALGYDESTFVRIMCDYNKKRYITLSSDGESDLEQPIDESNYGRIHISLNEPNMLEALLDDFIFLGEHMVRLTAFSKQLDTLLLDYNKNVSKADELSEKYQAQHSDLSSLKDTWEKELTADKTERQEQEKALKAEVEKIAEEKSSGIAESKAKETAGDEIEKELKLSGKIGAAMQDMQKDIIQFMGIFIAIFAIIGLNLNHAESWTISDFFQMNLVITASLTTLLFLVSVVLNNKDNGFRKWLMGILTVLLWGASIFVFFIFPYLKYKI
ncbi:MAG: hypothetical protein HFH94_01240 [Lachnospiraceae bacterium]|nr:hypothetical protein [uncultured Acetatifactor sp.]MCI9218358.1 hypothetical protein [Lachnospiraceae bacterium]